MTHLSYLLTHIPIVAAVVAVVSASMDAFLVVSGVRAKHRLKAVIAKDKDGRFRDLLSRARNSKMPEDDARLIIEEAAKRLSSRDKKLVYRGLNQGSRTGERRFIRELIS